MEKEKFHFHENSDDSGVRFTAAVEFDREVGVARAAYAFVNPKDHFLKVRGRGLAYSRLSRKPMVEFKEIPSDTKQKRIVHIVRNFGLDNAEDLRKFITYNTVIPDGKNKIEKTKYVSCHR